MLPAVLVIADDVPLEIKLVSLVLASVVSAAVDGTVPNLKIDVVVKVDSGASAETEKLLFPLVLATLLAGMLDEF